MFTLLRIACLMLATLPALAEEFDPAGPQVAWFGQITAAYRASEDSCFELTGPYDANGTLKAGADRRFKACAFGYYDPAVYAPGRWLKVIGTLQKSIPGQNMPLVRGAQLTLTSPPLPPPPPYWRDPWYDPWHPHHRRPYW